MGTRGREIVGVNTEKVLSLLTKAFADEWLAYYQYWLGAKVAKGPMKEAVIAELLQHAADELRHANPCAEPAQRASGKSSPLASHSTRASTNTVAPAMAPNWRFDAACARQPETPTQARLAWIKPRFASTITLKVSARAVPSWSGPVGTMRRAPA